MANRVSPADLVPYVKVPTGLDTTPFINDAHALIEAKMGVVPALADSIMTLIEKNLACHFFLLGQESGGVVMEKTGEASATYAGVKGSGISSTRFGQMVLSLDTTGAFQADLDAASGVKKALFRVA